MRGNEEKDSTNETLYFYRLFPVSYDNLYAFACAMWKMSRSTVYSIGARIPCQLLLATTISKIKRI